MRRQTLFGFLGAALLTVAAGTLLGTTVPRMNLNALVDGSDRILQGKVEAIETRIDAELKLPFTIVRVRVDDPICQRAVAHRGRCTSATADRRQTVFLKHLGGKMDSPNGPVTVRASGIPEFKVGENIIVFLRDLQDAGGNFQVVGLGQGKYEVINETAVSSIQGMELVDPKTGKVLPTGYAESAPVDAFKAKIRELVK